ncbi:uncharacterized protein [Rutidosis leptorrhynchoides]|uniref:uncharacterized protein n=1 Tax=Rutidosis leptorrhynchoides TaxID=125765 RepID=UPI003A9989BB
MLWDKLTQLITNSEDAWLICGDFIEVRDQIERFNCEFLEYRAKRFHNFINTNRLIDLPLGGRKFTRVCDEGIKFSKIDRFFVSNNFPNLWNDLTSSVLERNLFDHCPIMLKDEDKNFGPKPFKIFDMWFNDEDVEWVISEAWNSNVRYIDRKDCVFRNKLRNVKHVLKEWSRNKYSQIDAKIDELKNNALQLELKAESVTLSDSKLDDWRSTRKNLFDKERVKAEMLKQKARTKWILEGDENTNDIKLEFYNHFKQRFEEYDIARPSLEDLSYPTLTGLEAADLEAVFSENEIHDTILDCGSSKAPGPYGFNMGFFKRYWNLVKIDLIAAVNWFWEKPDFSRGCNSSFVTLVPKKSNPMSPKDFRPISLIVVNECVDFLKNNKHKGLLFKVDFEKAFDCLNWEFLIDVMKCMRFSSKWRRWILTCLSSASISIIVNRSPTNEFSLGRGIRQGDPLTPFLFIIAAEGLNILKKAAINCGLFKGVEIGSDKIIVSHLQYADDTIFIGECSRSNIDSLQILLKCFELAFRLKLGIPFTSSFVRSIGEESSASFWSSRWIGNDKLSNLFPRLFRLEINNDEQIMDRIRLEGLNIVTSWNWSRVSSGRTNSEMLDLTTLLSGFSFNNSGDDRWNWSLASDSRFTVKKLVQLVDENIINPEFRSRK